jgi:hypothetical protein
MSARVPVSTAYLSREYPQDNQSQYKNTPLILYIWIIVVVVGGVEREEKKALGRQETEGSQQVVEFKSLRSRSGMEGDIKS